MSRHYSCSRGHQWHLSDTASSLTAHYNPVCPECGAPAQASAPDLGTKGDSGSVRLALGPGPVEAKARVPEPLPVRQATVSAPPPPPVRPKPTEIVAARPAPVVPRGGEPKVETAEPAPSKSLIRHPGVAALAMLACMLPILVVVGFVLPQGRIAQERQRAEEARLQAQQAEERAAQLFQREANERAQAMAHLQAAEQARNDAIEQRDKAKADAKRADNAARDMDRRRQEQADLREQAVIAAKIAEELRGESQKGRGGAEGKLVHLYAGEGVRSMERRDLLESLVWLTEALRLAQGDANREAPHRMRLAAILAQCPRPVQAWFHDKPVMHAEFSRDSKRVLTLAKDGKARLWDAADGKAVGDALAGNADVVLAQFSRDGRRILTATGDFTARIWDAANGKPITPPLEHAGPILALALSPDGKRLHTISRDPIARGTGVLAWDAASGDSVGEPWELTHPVQAATFSPDGRLLLSTGLDGRAYLTDLTSKESHPAFDQGGTLRQIAFSLDGKLVATCAGTNARVWNAATRDAMSPVLAHPEDVSLIAVSPDGRRAATACADRVVRVWEIATGQQVGFALRQRAIPTTIAFGPDGRNILTAGPDGAAHLWDINTGQEIVAALWHGGPILAGAAFSPDGARVLTASGPEARIWDLTAGEPLATASDKLAERVTFSPDGKHFVRVTGDAAQLIATDAKKPIGEPLKHKNDISLATFSADGRRLLTVAQRPGQDSAEVEVRVWDAATGNAVGPAIELLRLVNLGALSPDGSRLAAATSANVVHVWDVATGKEIGKAIDYRNDPVTHLLFSPDGDKLISAAATGEVRVSDPATGDPLGPSLKHRQPLTYLALSADGRRLTTASADGTVQVSEVPTFETVAGSFPHGGPVVHFALSADSSQAATAGADGIARVWDAKTAKPIGPPLHHDNAVSQVAFSPDGRWLATASGDRVRLWDAATGEPLSGDLKPWRGGAAVTQLAFAKEGQLVAAHGQPGNPRGRHTLNLAPDNRPAAELAQVAMLFTGHRLDAAGAFLPSETDAMRKAWDALRAKSQRDVTSSPERMLAWHRRGADECEQNKQWAGVLLHAERLAELEPKSWEHRARRARTFAALERWQDAAAEYRKALEVDPDRGELLAGMARVEIELKMWQSASEWLNRAVRVTPDDRDLWALRGRAQAELGKLNDAATDLDKALKLGLNDAAVWHQRTLLRLAAGDKVGYPKACLQMRRRFGDTDDPKTVALLAWTCALAPDALPDLKPLLQRLETAARKDPKASVNVRAIAALLYRTGQFAPAAQRLEGAAKENAGKYGSVESILLAMTYHRLGRTADAKKLLEQTVKDDDAAVKALPWDERLALRTLRQEAEKLIAATKS